MCLQIDSSGRLFGITEIEGGFPHSEILGSKPVRGSPRLIAAYHVLHRLSAPRHPPDTLMTLDCSHNQRAESVIGDRSRDQISSSPFRSARQPAALGHCASSVEKTSFASNTSGSLAVKRGPRLRCSRQIGERTTETGCSRCRTPRGVSPQSTHPVRPNVFPLHDVIDAAPCNLHDTEWSSAPTASLRRGITKPEVRNQNANRRSSDFWLLISGFWSPATRTGGARRDRTDDLMLAKHALSQLSYGPASEARNQKSDDRTGF